MAIQITVTPQPARNRTRVETKIRKSSPEAIFDTDQHLWGSENSAARANAAMAPSANFSRSQRTFGLFFFFVFNRLARAGVKSWDERRWPSGYWKRSSGSASTPALECVCPATIALDCNRSFVCLFFLRLCECLAQIRKRRHERTSAAADQVAHTRTPHEPRRHWRGCWTNAQTHYCTD